MNANITEREVVEQVFGLTGGELSDKPQRYSAPGKTMGEFEYLYDGQPEHAEGRHEFQESDCFTVVGCYFYGAPETEILLRDKHGRFAGVFVLKAIYSSSGECACPCDGCDDYDDEICPFCGREPGDEHECAYLGDGWLEVVYVRKTALK